MLLHQRSLCQPPSPYKAVPLPPSPPQSPRSFALLCFASSFLAPPDPVVYIFICVFVHCLSLSSGGFSGGPSGKEPSCQCRRHKRRGFDSWIRKIPWNREITPVFIPGEPHKWGSLAGNKELDTTEVTQHAHAHSLLEGKIFLCRIFGSESRAQHWVETQWVFVERMNEGSGMWYRRWWC